MKKRVYATGVVKFFIFIFNLSKTMGEAFITVVCSLRGTLPPVFGTTFQPLTSS